MDESPNDVVILGAGFSRAVHEAFPLLSDLPALVLPHLKGNAAPSTLPLLAELRRLANPRSVRSQRKPSCPASDFEAWLSRIATDQPHLSLPENYDRRALFARTANAIRDVLLGATNKALDGGLPPKPWLHELLRLLALRGATVITTNYDTIIERLAQTQVLPWNSLTKPQLPRVSAPLAESEPCNDQVPSRPLPDTVFTTLRAATFVTFPPSPCRVRLIKLHGSIDWFAARGDATGDTLRRWELGFDSAARACPPGREPFLVPPDANKSPYFDNPVMRELWTQARIALEQATSVTLVGYSLPVTDTTFAGLLADTLLPRARRNGRVQVTVVDREPDPIIERLRLLGITAVGTPGGDDAVEDWKDAIIAEHARLTVDRLRALLTKREADNAIWRVCVYLPLLDALETPVLSAKRVSGGRLNGKTLTLDFLPDKGDTDTRPDRLTTILPLGGAERVVVDLGKEKGERPVVSWELSKACEPGRKSHLVMWPLLLPDDQVV